MLKRRKKTEIRNQSKYHTPISTHFHHVVQKNIYSLLRLKHKTLKLQTVKMATVNKLQMHETYPERPHKSAMREKREQIMQKLFNQ